MSMEWIKRGLRELKISLRPILDGISSQVIDEAIAELGMSKQRFDKQKNQTHHPGKRVEPWGYRIHRHRPLRFIRSQAKGAEGCWVDLSGWVVWEEGNLPADYCLHLRLWSDDPNFACRPEWDADEVVDRMSDGRVMLRCHFDLASPGPHGPRFHLQFGGDASADEVCWFPSRIRLPRLAYPPVDLILACQLVAANFYWEEYERFRGTSEWRSAILNSQTHLLARYYEECHNSLQHNLILLDTLWNVR